MHLRKVTNHGRTRWLLDVMVNGKRERRFFQTKALAETEAEVLKGQRQASGDAWMAMTNAERLEVISFLNDLSSHGVSLGQVWRAWRAGQVQVNEMPVRTLEQAIAETLAAKRAANRRHRYVLSLKSYLGMFAKGREAMPVSAITPKDIDDWFAVRKEANSAKRSCLFRLSAMFSFCKRRRYITENPCDFVERMSVEATPPRILTPDQAKRLVEAARDALPEALAYVVLAMFAGIRTDELRRLPWAEVDLDRALVNIDGAAAKTRQRRLVPLEPVAVAWLRTCTKRPGSIAPVNLFEKMVLVRKAAKLEWHQDIMRHTAASYLMALHQDAGKVASWLGNTHDVLYRHYREVVTPEDSQRFWASAPSKLHISGTVSAGRPD